MLFPQLAACRLPNWYPSLVLPVHYQSISRFGFVKVLHCLIEFKHHFIQWLWYYRFVMFWWRKPNWLCCSPLRPFLNPQNMLLLEIKYLIQKRFGIKMRLLCSSWCILDCEVRVLSLKILLPKTRSQPQPGEPRHTRDAMTCWECLQCSNEELAAQLDDINQAPTQALVQYHCRILADLAQYTYFIAKW